MAWNTIRVATTEEIDLLDARSVAFAMRHLAELPTIGYEEAIDLEGVISVDRSDDEAQTDTKRYLRKLWRRVVSRTLGAGAEGIAWGYVGYHTD